MLANRLAKLKRRGVGPTNNFVPPQQMQSGPQVPMGSQLNNPIMNQLPSPMHSMGQPQMNAMPQAQGQKRKLASPSFGMGMM